MKTPQCILLIVLVAVQISCKQKKASSECGDVACTASFAYLTVKVTDSAGHNVILDTVYTVNAATGDTIKNQQNLQESEYVVLDDNYQRNLVNKQSGFSFVGFKNGKVIVNEHFVIGADCCHIYKVSGPIEIKLL